MRRGLQLLALAAAFAGLVGTATAWYPIGIQCEFATATW